MIERSLFEISYFKFFHQSEHDITQALQAYEKQIIKQEGLKNHAIFRSFYSFPQKASQGVYVELIEWESKETQEQGRETHYQKSENSAFFKTIEVLGHFRIRPQCSGGAQVFAQLKKDQAVEFAARQIKKKEGYAEKRLTFMRFIKKQKGYAFDYEFSSLDENVDVLIFGWNSKTHFQKAGKKVMQNPCQLWRLFRYFRHIDNRAFQVGLQIQ